MKKITLACALILAMAAATLGGDIPTVPRSTPPCSENCTNGAAAPEEPSLIDSILAALSGAFQAMTGSLS